MTGLRVSSRALTLLLIVAAALLTRGAHADALPVGGPGVPPDVAAAVARDGSARVIVELTEEPMRPSEIADRAALRARMAHAQDTALGGLPPAGLTLTHRFEGLPGFAGVVDGAALERLARDPRVRSITLDRPGEGALLESIPLINADDVRDGLGFTGNGVVVAVLDSGFDSDHPDLAGALLYEQCYLLLSQCPGGGTTASGPGAAEDDHGHGTHVTGIITSNGVVAQKGVAPDVQIAAYKVLNANNAGFFSDWDAALSDIVANHPEVDVVNMSLVDNNNHAGSCDTFDPVATSAINSLRSAGTLTVVSSGNNAFTTGITFPACVSNAIAVGAVWDLTLNNVPLFSCTDNAVPDKVTCWSNSASTVDVLAPGAIIVAPWFNGGVAALAGTSMAAPHAVGVIAQLLDANGALTPAQIEAALENGGVPRTDAKNGITKPRVDAYGALLQATDDDLDGIPAAEDNCPNDYNPLQENGDRNFIDLTPPKAKDDLTWINSDPPGDACDPDDDNDGLADTAEPAGCSGSGALNPLLRDTDGDRALDNAECAIGTNPADVASKPTQALCVTASGAASSSTDTDGDGVKDYVEYCFYNSDKTLANTDGTSEFPLSSPPPGPLVAYCSDGREVASVDDNRTVNAADLGLVASAFGSYTAPPAPGTEWKMNMDIDKNGTVNAADLGLVASKFGACP